MAANAHLQMALDEITAHAAYYVRADRFVQGTQPEQFASAVFARLLKGSANRFRMNYARVPVTALCNRVKISSFGVPNDEASTEFLKKVWKDNGLGNVYREVHEQTASSGTAYLTAWPNPEDPTEQTIDISISDPITTRIFYDPENPRRAVFAARVWVEGKSTRVNLYYRDRIEKWVSKKNAGGKNAAAFVPYVDVTIENEDGTVDEVWPIPNPYDRIPVFHFHVGDGYGRPVNRDAWEPQDALNKLASTMMATVDYQGFPQRYVLQNPTGPEGDALDQWDDNDVTTSPKNITDGNKDTNQAGLKAGPAGVWFLDAKGAGQFEAADPDKFLKPVEQYVKAISTTTETPLHAFHGMGDAPSGESLRAANAPLNDNVLNFEGWVETTWIDLFDFILEIGGYGEKTVTMVWANPERADDLDYWTSVKTKIESGVPKRQALLDAGYTPEQVDSWGYTVESLAAAPQVAQTATPQPSPADGSETPAPVAVEQ